MSAKCHKDIFTAEDIDCTAPVHKVLEELRQRNTLAYMVYSNVLKPMPRRAKEIYYHFTNPGHPINAFDEEWDGELNLDYFEPFPYRSQPPRMITPMRNVHKADPVTILLRKKNDWYILGKAIRHQQHSEPVMESYEELNEEVVQCKKLLVDLAAHLDSEPEPYFDSPYNWYYAGSGNLQLACVAGADYLLHSEFSTVHLTEFNKNTLNISKEHVASFDCGEGNNILETIYSPQNIVVLRTKHKVFILKLINTDESIKLEKLKCIKSENMPYTSVTFDTFHNNILYITTLDYKLSIVNLDRMKARSVQLKAKVSTLVNNWNTVVSSDRGFYVHAGRTSVSIYDKRSNDMVHVWKDLRAVTADISCNDISVAEHFQGSDSLYFGTDHHLFKMDLRYCLKDGPKIAQRWTHCMVSPPAYMSHCSFELGKELICLSSQWCEDMCVVPNYINSIKDTNSGGMTIPYRPPSILSVLNEAKWNMLCNDLYNPLEPRLVTSITGNLIMERGENYEILMQNSFGDISCHTLYPEHSGSFIEDDSVQKLHEWYETYELEKKAFEVSSILNIAWVWKKLRKMPEDYKIFSYVKKPKTEFDEKEIETTFEEEEVEPGLQEAWAAAEATKGGERTKGAELELPRNVFYSDEE